MGSEEVTEVSFEQALAEESENQNGGDSPRPRPPQQQPTGQEAPIQEARDANEQGKIEAEEELATLAPPVASKEWTFGEGEVSRTYYQSELSVIGSAQWFKLLGEVLEDAMSGESALSLNSLLSPPTPRGQPGQFSLTDFQEADMFVRALGKLLTVMPEFLEKSVCIWLDVPDYEWELVRALMRRSPSKGGMTHDQFEGIVETFIDQNYSEIDRFFRERYPRLRDRWRARAKEASQSRSQKR